MPVDTHEGQKKWFSFELNLGHVLIFVGLMGSAIGVYGSILQTVSGYGFRIESLEKMTAPIPDTQVQLAKNDQQMANFLVLATNLRDAQRDMLKELTNIRIRLNSVEVQVPFKKNPPDENP